MSTSASSLFKGVKPRHNNPLLWTHILPLARTVTEDLSQSQGLESKTTPDSFSKDHVQSIPIFPENKNNVSLRMILHDTKSALEQFSDRLGTLVDGVDQAKREIDVVNKMFADGNEKMLEELHAVINRSQKGLLEAIGSPAQITALEAVKENQVASDRKLDRLETKTDLMQKQLQVISEQQGQILTSLATVTPLAPLLKDSPSQQAQIISSLGTLTPLLLLLQSLPTQLKVSQQEALEKFTASLDLACSGSSPCSTPIVSAKNKLRVFDPVSERTQDLKRKHSGQNLSRNEPQTDATASDLQQDRLLASSRTMSSDTVPSGCPLVKNLLKLPSSTLECLRKSSTQIRRSSAVSLARDKPSSSDKKEHKRQKLDTDVTGEVRHKDVAPSEPPKLPASTPLRPTGTAVEVQPVQTAFSQYKILCPPHLPVATTSWPQPPRDPEFDSIGSVPTPQAPGALLQSQLTALRKSFATTSPFPSRTPTPTARNATARRQPASSRILPQNSLSNPQFSHIDTSFQFSTTGSRDTVSTKPKIVRETVSIKQPPNTVQLDGSPSDLLARKRPLRRTGQRILFDGNDNSEGD